MKDSDLKRKRLDNLGPIDHSLSPNKFDKYPKRPKEEPKVAIVQRPPPHFTWYPLKN